MADADVVIKGVVGVVELIEVLEDFEVEGKVISSQVELGVMYRALHPAVGEVKTTLEEGEEAQVVEA